MSKENKNVRIAVVQASPVIMDLEKTVEKALGLIKEAGRKGANIIEFRYLNLTTYNIFSISIKPINLSYLQLIVFTSWQTIIKNKTFIWLNSKEKVYKEDNIIKQKIMKKYYKLLNLNI